MNSLLASLMDFYQYDFLLYALLGSLFLAIICGIFSPIIIAKKFSFIGEGISHSTLFGLSIALSLFDYEKTLLIFGVTLLITLINITILARSSFRQGLPSDSLIGIFLTTNLALGVLIHGLFAKGKSDLLSFLFGNILLLTPTDLILLLALFLLTLFFVLRRLKEWIYFCYDEEGATIAGLNTRAYHYGLFFLLGVVIVCSTKIAGTILANTLLLIPGALAFKTASSMRRVFLHSVIFSLASSLISIVLANWKGLPPGATLALTQFVLMMIILGIHRILKAPK